MTPLRSRIQRIPMLQRIPDSSLDIATKSPIPNVSTKPVDDTIIITQDNIDDFLDEPLQLQSELVHQLTSSLIPQRISNHGRAINHDALKSTQFA